MQKLRINFNDVSKVIKLTTFLISNFCLILVFAYQANAAAPVVITPYSIGNWGLVLKGDATGDIVNAPHNPILGNGSYNLKTISGTAGYLYDSEFYNKKLTSLNELKYSFMVVRRVDGTTAAPYISIYSVINDYRNSTELRFEPENNGGSELNKWQTLNAFDTSARWTSSKDLKDADGNVAVRAGDLVSWSTLTSLDKDAKLGSRDTASGIRIGYGQKDGGGSWQDFESYIDNITINGETYDFEPSSFTPPTAAAETPLTPSTIQLNSWWYWDDNAPMFSNPLAGFSNFNTSNHMIAPNPVASDGDNGAVRLNVSGQQRYNLATVRHIGKKLADIAAIRYSTYQPSTNPGNKQRAIYLNIDVDFNNSGWQGRLVYLPAQNGTVLQDTWQNWDPVAGNGRFAWSQFGANGNKWPDGNTSPLRNWNNIVAAFPNAKIAAQILFRAGEPYSDGFTGYIDHVQTAFTAENRLSNFELVNAPNNPKPVEKDVACGGVTGLSAITFSWGANNKLTTSYEVELVTPGNHNSANPLLLNSTKTELGISFNEGPGTYTLRVRANDSFHGQSAWSAPCNIQYSPLESAYRGFI